MARLPRFVIPDQPQHVIVRGNNRSEIFCADADYLFYLEKLQQACDKHDCIIHAYVLMTNHVHLLITPQTEEGLGKVMQMLGRYYVQYYNFTYQRTGTLWEGRYRATLIDSEAYLLTCMRYIELNPVRAGMVAHPSEYPWSSYRCNALGQANILVLPHVEYVRLARQMKTGCRHTGSYSSTALLKTAWMKSGRRRIRHGCWVVIASKHVYRSSWKDVLNRVAGAGIENLNSSK